MSLELKINSHKRDYKGGEKDVGFVTIYRGIQGAIYWHIEIGELQRWSIPFYGFQMKKDCLQKKPNLNGKLSFEIKIISLEFLGYITVKYMQTIVNALYSIMLE